MLFPPPRVSRTLGGGLEPHSMAGCVECQEEGVRQGKGLATVSQLDDEQEWRWEKGWDRQPVHRPPAWSRDLSFSIQGLGEEGGLDSPSLCKSCSAAAGSLQSFGMKAKSSGPRGVGKGWAEEERGQGVSGPHRPPCPCSLSFLYNTPGLVLLCSSRVISTLWAFSLSKGGGRHQAGIQIIVPWTLF